MSSFYLSGLEIASFSEANDRNSTPSSFSQEMNLSPHITGEGCQEWISFWSRGANIITQVTFLSLPSASPCLFYGQITLML